MKGLHRLAAKIASSGRSLIEMRDAGRFGNTVEAMRYVEALYERLDSAQMFINLLRNYEVAHCADQDNISTQRSD